MSHTEQLNFIEQAKQKHTSHFSNAKVLEIGSLDINGSVRQFFTNCEYIGVDLGEGKGVDIVCEGQLFEWESNYFDTVISCECFEHNPYWVDTFKNMINKCRSNGLVLMTCATTGRREHGTSRKGKDDSPLTIQKGWEYYKNLTEIDFKEEIDLSCFSTYEFSVNDNSHDLYFIGIKK